MKKPVLLLVLLIVIVLAVFTSTKAQKQFGTADRLRILKVSEGGVRLPDFQAKPDVIGFSCTTGLADTEPTCYALLRDRVF